MADNRIDVAFGADIGDLVSGVEQVRQQLASLATAAQQLGTQIGAVGAGAVSALGGNATAAFEQFKNAADDGNSGLNDFVQSVNFFQGTLDSVLQGVLLGTQTWQQAMARVFANLAASFVELIANMVIQGMSMVAMQALGGSLDGGMSGLWSGLFSVGSSAAAAEGGSTLGEASVSLAALATGAWAVPQDMIAMVHAGEMVLPAETAAMVRSGAVPPFAAGAPAAGASGAGFNFNVTVQAIDASSVAQWANANAKTLATTVSRYMNSNPGARGNY